MKKLNKKEIQDAVANADWKLLKRKLKGTGNGDVTSAIKIYENTVKFNRVLHDYENISTPLYTKLLELLNRLK